MKIGLRGFLIGIILSCIAIGYGFATLSFDSLNYNIFTGIFLIAFIYLAYAIVYFSAVYNQEIFDKTIKKVEKKIERIIGGVTSRKRAFRLFDLSAIVSYLILALISTSAPNVFLSAIPGDEFLKPIFEYLLGTYDGQNISIPYISSLKFLMLSCVGPIVVFVIRIAHILKVEEKKHKNESKKNSKLQNIENKNKFPGVRALTIFLFVAPVVLLISRLATSQPIEFDFTLVSLMMLGFLSWLIAWFLQAFENIIFANMLTK